MAVELAYGGLGEPPVPRDPPVGKKPFVPLIGIRVVEIGVSSVVTWPILVLAGQFVIEAAHEVIV
jgi:hypothetical protein